MQRSLPVIFALLAEGSFSLLAVSSTPAQSRPTRVEHLIRSLDAEAECETAARELARLGAAALPDLLAALEPARGESTERFRMIVFLIGKLGADAAPAARRLCALIDGAEEQEQRQLLWALFEIGPAGARAYPDLRDALGSKEVQRGRTWQEWSLVKARLDFGPAATAEALAGALEGKDVLQRVAAAVLLRQGAACDRSVDAALLAATESALEQWRRIGAGYQRFAHETSLALVRWLPNDPLAVPARCCLLSYHDPEVRVAAAAALSAARRTPDCVPFLIAALDDSSRRVVREALVMLADHGAEAFAALVRLEDLGDGTDREIVTLARAAERRIRERPTTAQSRATRMLDPDAEVRRAARREAEAEPEAVGAALDTLLRLQAARTLPPAATRDALAFLRAAPAAAQAARGAVALLVRDDDDAVAGLAAEVMRMLRE